MRPQHYKLSPFSTRRIRSREATFSFVGVAFADVISDADKGKSRFARKKSPSGERALRLGNTGNMFLQLAMQHCYVASWKALLHVLPPTSNIVTQQNFVVASWSSMLHQVELASTFFNTFFQHATTYFVAWQCLRWVVIRPTTLFNLQCNNVALQVVAICCSYYFTLTYYY